MNRPGLPSPSKKPRLGTADIPATPPLSDPRSSSTSVSIDSLAAALPEPSRQSAARFFATLAALPGKYSLDEDDDDIVDFETDSIIPGKKGLLSRSNTEWQFGCFAPPRTDDTEESGTPAETVPEPVVVEEDDTDELDLITPRSPQKSPKKDSRAQSVHLPEPSALHLPPLDPSNNAQDAEDLQDFLQEEALRNERLRESTSDAVAGEEGGEDEDEDEDEGEYIEVFEDSEIPIADAAEGDNPEASGSGDDSDEMGGYDAGEGSIVRNTDGSIRSMPTPRQRSPSRARSRSISVKPLQHQIYSPLKQPNFSRSPVKLTQPQPSTRSSSKQPSSRASSPARPSPRQFHSDTPPTTSPLKDIRIKPRSRPSQSEKSPPAPDSPDPFLRPRTPQPKSTRKSRPPSPEVLPPPSTPPLRSPSTPTRASRASRTRASSASPTLRPLRSRERPSEPDELVLASPSRNTHANKGKAVMQYDDDESPSRNTRSNKGKADLEYETDYNSSRGAILRSQSASPSKGARQTLETSAIECVHTPADFASSRGKKRKRTSSTDMLNYSDNSHHGEMEDTFQYPFRSRSHSPIAQNDRAPHEGTRLQPPESRTPNRSRSRSRARAEVPGRQKQYSRPDRDEATYYQSPSRPPPPPSTSPSDYDGTEDRRLSSDVPASHSRLPLTRHPSTNRHPPPHFLQPHDPNPRAVFTQAMQAMQAMSAMMMQYAAVVDQGEIPVHAPPTYGNGTPSRGYWPQCPPPAPPAVIDWTQQDDAEFPIPSSSSSPIRYPPPSSPPSSPYSYEEPDPGDPHPLPSSSNNRLTSRSRNPSISSPSKSSTSPLPSALVLRTSPITRSRSHSRLRKRVSFELKSVEQVVDISSDEERGYTRNDYDNREEPRIRRGTRATTPAPSERPLTHRSPQSRRGTPAPTDLRRQRPSSPDERLRRRSSQRFN